MTVEQKKSIRDLVIKHTVPKVIAKDEIDKDKAEKMNLFLAYQLGLEEVIENWVFDLEEMFDSIEHTAEIRALNKVKDWAMEVHNQTESVTTQSLLTYLEKSQQLIEEVK
jgi:hypothetical protein